MNAHPEQVLPVIPCDIRREISTKEEGVTDHGDDGGPIIGISMLYTCLRQTTVGPPYMTPPINTSVTPNLLSRDSCNRQTIGSGKTKMTTSETTFMDPYATPAFCSETQWPGSVGFQYLEIGVQPNARVKRLLSK